MKDEDGYYYYDDYGRKCRCEDDETDVDAREELTEQEEYEKAQDEQAEAEREMVMLSELED